MGEDDEMKVQCFGGDYMGEVFDPMLKRTTYRRQKRWWNAYMLFYTRHDVEENDLIKAVNEMKISKLEKKKKYRRWPTVNDPSRFYLRRVHLNISLCKLFYGTWLSFQWAILCI